MKLVGRSRGLETGGEEGWREGPGAAWVRGVVRDESRGWKRDDSASQRVKAAPSGCSMCVKLCFPEIPTGCRAKECLPCWLSNHVRVLIVSDS